MGRRGGVRGGPTRLLATEEMARGTGRERGAPPSRRRSESEDLRPVCGRPEEGGRRRRGVRVRHRQQRHARPRVTRRAGGRRRGEDDFGEAGFVVRTTGTDQGHGGCATAMAIRRDAVGARGGGPEILASHAVGRAADGQLGAGQAEGGQRGRGDVESASHDPFHHWVATRSVSTPAARIAPSARAGFCVLRRERAERTAPRAGARWPRRQHIRTVPVLPPSSRSPRVNRAASDRPAARRDRDGVL